MGPEVTERLAIVERPDWQMAFGERAAIEGLLSQLKPKLAVEIGTAEGGSLQRIAAHSTEVHAIDLTGELLRDLPGNATFHEGDSRTALPPLLSGFEAAGRRVDFVLVDGDHTRVGARDDIRDLLESKAVESAVILVHDSFNAEVRAGIEDVKPAGHPKVAAFDLDFIPGRVGRLGPFEDQLLGGFAVIIVSPGGILDGKVDLGYWSLDPDPPLVHDSHAAADRLGRLVGSGLRDAPAGVAAERLLLEPGSVGSACLRRELESMRSSLSWRLTAPLRRLGAWRPR